MIFKLVKYSILDIFINKVRTSLTILGIVIGIASVTTLVSVGESSKTLISNVMTSNFSADVLVLFGGPRKDKPIGLGKQPIIGYMSNQDYFTLKSNNINGISYISRRNTTNALFQYKDKEQLTRIILVDPDYFKIIRYKKIAGNTFLSTNQISNNENILQTGIILTKMAADDLFKNNDQVIEKEVKLNSQTFYVMGIIKGTNDDFSSGELSTEKTIFVDFNSYSQIMNNNYQPLFIMASLTNKKDTNLVKKQIDTAIINSRGLSKNDQLDFNITSQDDIIQTMNQITKIITIFLTFVASISLFVGGIGVMNIILVSISDRIKEFGLRKALGATNQHIFYQILIESLILNLFGGILGILVGNILTALFQMYANLPLQFSYTAGFSGLITCTLVGLIFGIYPAIKASKLSPIEALRAE